MREQRSARFLLVLLVLFCAVLLPFAGSGFFQIPTVDIPTVTGTDRGIVVRVKNDSSNPQINVRSGPGTEYDRVGTLVANQEAIGKGRTEGGSWILIEYPGGPDLIPAQADHFRIADQNACADLPETLLILSQHKEIGIDGRDHAVDPLLPAKPQKKRDIPGIRHPRRDPRVVAEGKRGRRFIHIRSADPDRLVQRTRRLAKRLQKLDPSSDACE